MHHACLRFGILNTIIVTPHRALVTPDRDDAEPRIELHRALRRGLRSAVSAASLGKSVKVSSQYYWVKLRGLILRGRNDSNGPMSKAFEIAVS
jgi:hypothetical protein